LRFPHQNPVYASLRSTCPAHLILLHFITGTILGEEQWSFSSSFCSFLHFPVNVKRWWNLYQNFSELLVEICEWNVSFVGRSEMVNRLMRYLSSCLIPSHVSCTQGLLIWTLC
jgi:hypothetical protein